MRSPYKYTRHANERSSARVIPPMIAEIIIEYGEPRDAGDGALKYALTKQSMRQLRQVAGRQLAKAIEPYRNRNAYVVAAGGRIITVAYASYPLFH
ncbi:hypothetical protein [Tardiphaga sp.]|uniref:hypothetical protein n=1 Tax=Tardiphaga sp. TaxID=1926292 RepID=UPI0025D3F8AA|nr:hypothetical protein [Tardiphaga sp.]